MKTLEQAVMLALTVGGGALIVGHIGSADDVRVIAGAILVLAGRISR